jgi:4-hydroxybenzoyl-CoA thioesterase/acyl-CoA thioester hydrolase
VARWTFQRRVEFAETDAAGIVHFASLMIYMEQAEHAFLRAMGLSVFPKPGNEFAGTWPRVRVSCEFFAPARFEDELTILVQIDRIGRSSVTYRMELERSGEAIAKGTMTSVHCRHEEDRLVPHPIPEEIRRRLQPFVAEPSPKA